MATNQFALSDFLNRLLQADGQPGAISLRRLIDSMLGRAAPLDETYSFGPAQQPPPVNPAPSSMRRTAGGGLAPSFVPQQFDNLQPGDTQQSAAPGTQTLSVSPRRKIYRRASRLIG